MFVTHVSICYSFERVFHVDDRLFDSHCRFFAQKMKYSFVFLLKDCHVLLEDFQSLSIVLQLLSYIVKILI